MGDVLEKLNGLNGHKATGSDNIPPELIKLGAIVLCRPLTFALSICTGTFPTLLKKSDVTPVYKKNDRLEIGNYRPISVLPCLSKISE